MPLTPKTWHLVPASRTNIENKKIRVLLPYLKDVIKILIDNDHPQNNMNQTQSELLEKSNWLHKKSILCLEIKP